MTKSGVVGKSALEIPREVQSAGVPANNEKRLKLQVERVKIEMKEKE
ncbi:hypothetical protein A2U01_0099642, partial [Trifolium medium]|nr:hypothetical protein [Trifolium medium]